MKELYGLEPVRAVERLAPVLARSHEAAALEVAEGSPLMLVERTAYAEDGTAVEFAHDRHRGDRASFVIEVAADAAAYL
jgi:DNA-binding GntR family transcriptional regulator